ncbi:S-adenosyl-L-methionine-dependent methyltransferase [Dendryphion nanum]|uniref:S-adenosyl-L-methionine-dependent methyltransferase n=1 Tax=Dendryphion nanum TaxID=256645 RepID=A0A9P9E7S2_9PLEO|nr:S-adenosyl-L-methionine-dependent methyltransferase [Dendryphion nanum]
MSPSLPLYDDPSFHNAYLLLPRQTYGLSHAPEWPTLRSLLGPTNNTTILDLGCGLGWFARWAAASPLPTDKNADGGSATHITAYDISTTMISKAIQETKKEGLDGKIDYKVADLSKIELDTEAMYDIAFSSLALHYLSADELARLLAQVYTALKPTKTSRIVFSVEHPIYTAPASTPAPNFESIIINRETQRQIWPLESYAEEGAREREWLGTKGVVKYHRTIQTWFESLTGAGFVVTGLKEWMPSREDVEGREGWEGERDRPMFLLVRAERREG